MSEARPISEVEERLAEAADRLRRALDRTRLYGVSHPESRAAIEEVWRPLSAALAVAAPVSLDASVDGLSWRGRVLVTEDDEHEGIGRLLHREGIASLTLHGSMSRQELEKLLDILRINLGLPEFEEETLEALLWQARLEGVTFRAVAELMEAEAISGDAVRYLQDREVDEVQALFSASSGRGSPSRSVLPEDMLVQAIEQAGGELALAAEDEGLWDDGEDWSRRFDEDLAQDAEAVARLRGEIEAERPGDQVRHAVQALLHIARARDPGLDPATCLQLARTALIEVQRQRDTFALVQFIGELHAARERESDPHQRITLDSLVATATEPRLIARLLASAGPDADPAATDQLVEMLDDAAIQALIELSFPGEGDAEQDLSKGRWLAATLGEVTARKARRWLSEEQTPTRLVVPAVQLLRGRDLPEDRALRPHLLRHPVAKVQEVVMAWYVETGIPAEEVDLLVARLEDPRRRIRRSTWLPLARHPPPELSRWLRSRLNPRTLAELPEELQVDLCVACGRILGPRALPLLDLVMDARVGLFAGPKEARLLLAAALGIAAVGSPEARGQLEEGSKSWVGARAQACKTALQRWDEGRL